MRTGSTWQGLLVILAVTLARQNVLVSAIVAIAATAWVMSGSPITAVESIFSACLAAASKLFGIFLIIAMVAALLGALRAMDADQRMVMPFGKVIRGGWSAYLALVVVTSSGPFFWPTPAVPLIGAVLVPAAIRAGLPAMGAAMAIAIAVAGQGMVLSSDYIVRVAPGLSAEGGRCRSVESGRRRSRSVPGHWPHRADPDPLPDAAARAGQP